MNHPKYIVVSGLGYLAIIDGRAKWVSRKNATRFPSRRFARKRCKESTRAPVEIVEA